MVAKLNFDCNEVRKPLRALSTLYDNRTFRISYFILSEVYQPYLFIYNFFLSLLYLAPYWSNFFFRGFIEYMKFYPSTYVCPTTTTITSSNIFRLYVYKYVYRVCSLFSILYSMSLPTGVKI